MRAERVREADTNKTFVPLSFHTGDLFVNVRSVGAPYADLIQATVARSYADSAGTVYQFELIQRYYSPEPGVWQRLPPDSADFARVGVWHGRRIDATFPELDRPVLAGILPLIDAGVCTVCAGCECPDDLRLEVVFSGELSTLDKYTPPDRSTRHSANGYPIIFDIPPERVINPHRLTLPAPRLAGSPRGPAAAEALRRAVTMEVLGFMAEILAHSGRSNGSFLDALIARAEIRIGISPEPQARISPRDSDP